MAVDPVEAGASTVDGTSVEAAALETHGGLSRSACAEGQLEAHAITGRTESIRFIGVRCSPPATRTSYCGSGRNGVREDPVLNLELLVVALVKVRD